MNWILFSAKRLTASRAKDGSAVPAIFSIAGLSFGVMVLIVILSVMNGLQGGFITALLELSSAHVRLTGTRTELEKVAAIGSKESFVIFSETQALVRSNYNSQQAVSIHVVPTDILSKDAGLKNTITMPQGSFDISEENTGVIGYGLAQLLSVNVGDTISILVASGSKKTELFPKHADIRITGLFKSGFYEIDSSFCYISTKTGAALLGSPEEVNAAVKFKNPEHDIQYITEIKQVFPTLHAESWRSYNHSFFGALKIEKNLMLILITLIFVVVAVNIHNGMRRAIHQRREDIAVLNSLGASKKRIQAIFVLQGAGVGVLGAIIGTTLGVLASLYINEVFAVLEAIVTGLLTLIAYIRSLGASEQFRVFNPHYFYMETIPSNIVFSEVLYIFLFALASAMFAAYSASKKLLALKPSEVLRYE